MLYGSRRFYTGFGFLMAVFFLYGPIPARIADHNGYRYLIGPFVCPLLAALCHVLLPYNPYRSGFRSDRGIDRLDQRDEAARRLVELLRSDGCRRVVLRTAAAVAALLFPVMAGFALGFRASLNWNLPSPWLIPGVAGGTLFAWITIRVQTIGWALEAWWKEAEASQAA